MITVNNSVELNSVLVDSTLEPVQFPDNSNLILGYGQNTEIVNELEGVAATARRSLHLC